MYLIQSHSVELDSLVVLTKFKIYVAHVDLEPPGVVEHSVLCYDLSYISYPPRQHYNQSTTWYVLSASVYISLAAYWLARLNRTLKVRSKL